MNERNEKTKNTIMALPQSLLIGNCFEDSELLSDDLKSLIADLEKQVAQYREALEATEKMSAVTVQVRFNSTLIEIHESFDGKKCLCDPFGYLTGENGLVQQYDSIFDAFAALGSMEERDEKRISNDERN